MRHPAADLLRTYVEEGIPAHTGPPWYPQAMQTSIYKGPHASDCTPEMNAFIQGDMQRRIKYGFRILLLTAEAIRLFGDNMKLSRIVAAPHAYFRPHLILNLLAHLDSDTPSVNDTTNREAAPESLQFGWSPPPAS